ncbi:hypothetical protein HanXRQr2_Chr13g0582811 [Helianthus annuus]|uniref:Uncharacterized protein n=1 Tax=Helianthus annuus TaxID=4232 RepID=A0A9K3HB83_HELAN|nr:hypothetical protein HanXRQr2_Chr13g0582811 [Helianthus annuus]KAJ0848734.1 hypothetical protein HanPSC8_Chr13g0560941 [Helianthus annuus]
MLKQVLVVNGSAPLASYNLSIVYSNFEKVSVTSTIHINDSRTDFVLDKQHS